MYHKTTLTMHHQDNIILYNIKTFRGRRHHAYTCSSIFTKKNFDNVIKTMMIVLSLASVVGTWSWDLQYDQEHISPTCNIGSPPMTEARLYLFMCTYRKCRMCWKRLVYSDVRTCTLICNSQGREWIRMTQGLGNWFKTWNYTNVQLLELQCRCFQHYYAFHYQTTVTKGSVMAISFCSTIIIMNK